MPDGSRSKDGRGRRLAGAAGDRTRRLAIAGTARARRGARGAGPALRRTWRALNLEQRATAVGALLLAVSTLGPFSWVEAAILLVAAAVLVLLKKRADRAAFHLPFGDGTVIAVAGVWCGVLILVRLFDRPLGQALLALACAAVLVGAGLRERSKHPPDDVPTEPLAE